MQGPLDPGSIVAGERTDSIDNVIEIRPPDSIVAQKNGSPWKPGFGTPPQIHDHFDQIIQVRFVLQYFPDRRRHDIEQEFKIV
jgi:hypothetical protein